MNPSGHTAVITGANGFIGRSLVAHAKSKGAHVVAVSRTEYSHGPDIEAVTVPDYRDTPVPENAVLIHLAGTRDVGKA